MTAMVPIVSRPSRESRLIYDGLFLAILVAAFLLSFKATHALITPFDPDLYRDTGQAYNILGGNFFGDGQFLGERQWYNPLVPTLVAAISEVFGIAPNVAYARAVAYLNL